MARSTSIILWVMQIACAALFLFAGSRKLMADPMMVGAFAKVGLGQWFRYVTGGLEIVGGLGLLWSRTAALAAALLAVVMIGAIIAHLTRLGGSPGLAIVLLAASSCILWFRRDRLPGV